MGYLPCHYPIKQDFEKYGLVEFSELDEPDKNVK